MITLRTGIGRDFDGGKGPYHKISDGGCRCRRASNITTLLLTLLCRYMRPLIEMATSTWRSLPSG